MTTLVAVFIKPLRLWQAEIVGSKVSKESRRLVPAQIPAYRRGARALFSISQTLGWTVSVTDDGRPCTSIHPRPSDAKQESMHPPLPDLFLAEIFANIEQLLIFNKHVVAEFTEIYRSSKVGRLACLFVCVSVCCISAGWMAWWFGRRARGNGRVHVL